MARPKKQNPRSKLVNFRLTEAEFDSIESEASAAGFESLSDYLRYLHEQHATTAYKYKVIKENPSPYGVSGPSLYRKTERGKIYHGDSLGLLHETLEPDSVDLIMTSPPIWAGEEEELRQRRRRPICRVVSAIRRRHATGPQTKRKPGHRYQRFMEKRSTDAFAVSFRATHYIMPRLRIPPLPGVLLVESGQAAHPSRVGQYQKDQSQGRGELYLVAVANPVAEGL